ncbi:MAG: epoxide hydrolase [Candidatus Binatia bacterium]|nr:MAG: epoxide hydrolase [Candidatus Binatia bacterium]
MHEWRQRGIAKRMSEFQHHYLDVNGIRIHAVEAGEGFPVLLCHGFPEIWYSWRHQLRALAEAGYRAIAPDQRGYGETTVPAEVDKYSIHHLVGDLTGLLDALGIEQAVVVGHDWGGLVTWQMALLAPHRVAGVVGVNTPFFPRLPVSPLAVMRQLAQGQFHYILYFQEPGVADEELGRDVRRSLRAFYQQTKAENVERVRSAPPGVWGAREGGLLERLGDAPLPPYMTAADFDVFARAFEQTGFTGGLNWYRNMERNWETTAYLAGAKVAQPALMITAEWDPVLRPEMAAGMERWVPKLRRTVLIRECGHWTQQEKPEEVNAALLEFLDELGLKG